MYRSRPKGDLKPESLNFMSSVEIDKELLLYDVLSTEAHVIMLHERKLLERKELKPILFELRKLLHEPNKLVIQGYEDIHEALEAHLVNKLGMEIGGRIQTGRSRNDQVILDIKMLTRDELNRLCLRIIRLVEGILEKAQENMNSIMPLYTHLQQAQIGNLSHYFLSYSEQLFRDLERLYNAYTKINKSPLGAGPIGGSSLPVDRERTALLLGFKGLVTNSIDATSSRDSIVEVLSALSILMITLSRIAEDFIIWSTQEFGYLEIADNFASTSSAMPHKKNPDPLELIRSKAAIVSGNLMTSLMILRGLPSGYNRDLQDLKKVLFDSLSLVYDSLGMIDAIVRTIIIHDRRMNQAVIDSFANSIDIAEQLVVKYGLSFRTAHRLVGSMVRVALDKKGLSLSSLSQDDIEHAIVGKSNELKAEEVLNILQETDPKEMLLSRAVQGSPNPRMQKAAIKISRIRLQKYMDKLIVRKKLLKTSLDTLTRVSWLYLNKK